jgi:hypothetical protein
MRIQDLFVIEQTVAPIPPGQPIPSPVTSTTQANNTGSPQNTSTTTSTNTIPVIPGQQPMGQQTPMGQKPQQQMAQTTLTSLDKLAAQIVGLKQQIQQQNKPS